MPASAVAPTVTEELPDDQMPYLGSGVSRDINMGKYEFCPWIGKLLVKRFSADEESKGGLVIPNAAKEEKSWGTVITVPRANPPDGIKSGDLVLFHVGAGTDMDNVLGEGYVLLDYLDPSDNDLLGIFVLKTYFEKI